MKKLKIIIFGTLFLSLFSSFDIPKVEALSYQTLTQVPISDVYYTRRGGGKPYMTAQYNTYTMNGKVVYCVEPGVNIDTHSYVGEDGFVLIEAPYSTATNKKIELIGHYGYDYPGHQTLRYRMAAQSLIWEETGGQIVEFWTEMGGFGDYINLDYEKNQIMNLVNKHYDKPSFHNSTYNVVIGQEFTVVDTSGILSEYEIYSSDGLDVRISGNTLYIKATKTGNLQLNMRRKHYDSATTMVFKGADARSQNMGYFRFSDPVTAFITIHSVGGKITINKVDSETGKTPQGEALLTGATYGLYDSNKNLVETLVVDSSGNATSKYLELGTYTLKELSAGIGYLVDPTEHVVTITESNLNITVTSKEQVIKRDIEIMKSYSLAGTGILTPESSITFEIYNRNNTLVRTVITDSQGYAKILGLPYGYYRVHQVNAPSGVNKVQDFNFWVQKDSPNTIKFNIVNDYVESYLRLIKKDLETGKTVAMAGIKFKIFDIDNNEYVYMKTMYPTPKIIDTFETDENGVFITPEMLKIGHYRIEELDQSINGYLWNKNPLEFYINGESGIFYHEAFGFILQLEFYNEQVKGSINIHKTGEELIIKDGTYYYQNKNLAGIKFGLYASEDIIINGYKYYSENELIGTYISDVDGKISITNLPLGKYKLIEIETLPNLILDKNIYEIELKYKDQNTPIIEYNLELENYYKKSTLEFSKTDLTTGKPISDVVIEIYTESDELIFTGTTDKYGKIIITDLFVGKFYIVEKLQKTGYKINEEKVFFEITEDGEVIKSSMTNEKIKGKLVLSKIDLETGEAIPNTEFEIYNEFDELVFTSMTDENGLLTIELEYGRYYILEKNPAPSYLNNTEKVYFDILEDESIINITMTNEKIPVPNTAINDFHIEYILSGVALLGGIGVLIYDKKRKKK